MGVVVWAPHALILLCGMGYQARLHLPWCTRVSPSCWAIAVNQGCPWPLCIMGNVVLLHNSTHSGKWRHEEHKLQLLWGTVMTIPNRIFSILSQKLKIFLFCRVSFFNEKSIFCEWKADTFHNKFLTENWISNKLFTCKVFDQPSFLHPSLKTQPQKSTFLDFI